MSQRLDPTSRVLLARASVLRSIVVVSALVFVGCDGESDETGGQGTEASDDTVGGTMGTVESGDGSNTQPTSGAATTVSADSTGPQSDEEDSATDDDPAVQCFGVCVPSAVPDGWSEPTAIYESENSGGLPKCGGAATAPLVAFAGLDVPDASCECGCVAATGASCDAVTLQAWDTDNTTCGGAPLFSLAIEAGNDCAALESFDVPPVGIPDVDYTYWNALTESSGGSCDSFADETIPTPAFATRVNGCEVDAIDGSEGCEQGDQCMQRPVLPFDDKICIFREGDHECADFYTDKTLYYSDVTDTRSCSGCECGEPTGSCPGSAVDLFGGTTCSGDGEFILEACTHPCLSTPGMGCGSFAASVTAMVTAGVASCEASVDGAAALSGSAEPSDPVTICCTP